MLKEKLIEEILDRIKNILDYYNQECFLDGIIGKTDTVDLIIAQIRIALCNNMRKEPYDYKKEAKKVLTSIAMSKEILRIKKSTPEALELEQKRSWPNSKLTDLNLSYYGEWILDPKIGKPFKPSTEHHEIGIPFNETKGPEPKNNDGRLTCFWCTDIKTEKRGAFECFQGYDICPKCEQ